MISQVPRTSQDKARDSALSGERNPSTKTLEQQRNLSILIPFSHLLLSSSDFRILQILSQAGTTY